MTSERLSYRRFKQEDIPALQRIVSNPITMRYVSNGKPWPPKRTEAFVKWNMEHSDDIAYAICRRDGDELIGAMMLAIYDYEPNFLLGKWVITIFISMREQGKGYGKEAVLYLLSIHRDKEIFASIEPSNTGSRRLFESAGFEKVGTLHYKKGPSDVFRYAARDGIIDGHR